MPWENNKVLHMKQELETLIKQEFGISVDFPVYCCTKKELVERIVSESFFSKLPKNARLSIKIQLQFIIGRYFSDTNEIWVVHGKGDRKGVILHKLLHAIQKCKPHRENIVDYIVWHYLKDSEFINNKILKEWQEIENAVGFERIKQQLLKNEDCENF